jgi:hypothetical protein
MPTTPKSKSIVKPKPKAKPVVVKKVAVKKAASPSADLDVMFDLAAETFRVMSAPMRLKIINCLEEKVEHF